MVLYMWTYYSRFDSICSAISLAYLMNKIGRPAIPARLQVSQIQKPNLF